MPDQCQNIFFRNKLILKTSPPPSPKKFWSVYHFRGPKIFRTYQNFSKHHTNFPDITKFPTKITQFPTKLTEFFPFFFVISQYCPTVDRILPDWLCLTNKPGGGCILYCNLLTTKVFKIANFARLYFPYFTTCPPSFVSLYFFKAPPFQVLKNLKAPPAFRRNIRKRARLYHYI